MLEKSLNLRKSWEIYGKIEKFESGKLQEGSNLAFWKGLDFLSVGTSIISGLCFYYPIRCLDSDQLSSYRTFYFWKLLPCSPLLPWGLPAFPSNFSWWAQPFCVPVNSLLSSWEYRQQLSLHATFLGLLWDTRRIWSNMLYLHKIRPSLTTL